MTLYADVNVTLCVNVDVTSSLQDELPGVVASDNLATLPEVTEASLLEQLRARYADNRIYVSSYCSVCVTTERSLSE